MKPLNHKLRKYTEGYKLHKLQEKNQLSNVYGRHQMFAKNEKEE